MKLFTIDKIVAVAFVLFIAFMFCIPYRFDSITTLDVAPVNASKHVIKKFTVTIPIVVTAYSPTKDQCDDDPLITASNIRVRDGIIALSRDLEKDLNLKFGDRVSIEGVGEFEFQDRMNRRWLRKADIFMWSREEALRFGKQNCTLIADLKIGGIENAE